jgi:hypothetical protein
MNITEPTRRRGRVLWALLWIVSLVASLLLILPFLNMLFPKPGAQTLISLDWSGYVVASDSTSPQPVIVGVRASWTVPEVKVTTKDSFSAAWIGIGGQLDDSLIQAGTEHDSIAGSESYSAWYELIPADAVTIAMSISSGDRITASINLLDSTSNGWLIQVYDATNGQTFNETFLYDASRLTAEWIVERPTVGHSLSTLTDFGSITFTDAEAKTDNTSETISKYSSLQVVMHNRQNIPLVSVSPLSSDGSSFTVTYSTSATTPPSQGTE